MYSIVGASIFSSSWKLVICMDNFTVEKIWKKV